VTISKGSNAALPVLPALRLALQTYLPETAPLIVAVSGGADSLALLHALWQLQPEMALQIHVAHFDHNLRPDSATDAAFVAQQANTWRLPFYLGQADVASQAAKNKQSLETAARHARYAFFATLAHQIGSPWVLTAHHADDQIETILLHLLRGSGLTGLQGMAMLSPLPGAPTLKLFRPLLLLPGWQLRAYCTEHGLAARHDSTNDDPQPTRNFLRLQVLPLLKERNPNLLNTLQRTADLLREDAVVLQHAQRQAWAQVLIHQTNNEVCLARSHFMALLPSLQRAILRQAMQALYPQTPADYTPLQQALQWLPTAQNGKHAPLAGHLTLWVEQAHLWVLKQGSTPQPLRPQAFPALQPGQVLDLPATGSILLPNGWQCQIVTANQPSPPASRWQLPITAAGLAAGLQLRTWRTGDFFYPKGLTGKRQLLADYFRNAKIPAQSRTTLALLVAGDVVVWVPGWRAAESPFVQSQAELATAFCCFNPPSS
jgi:tRNA(Ile)-lysidine synthase